MNKDIIFDKIEAWLSGELPETEARAFEAEIAADTKLATEVERHRRGREALDRLAKQALEADMALWRESLDDLPEPPRDALPTAGAPNRLRWILGGMFLILFGGMAYWLWPSGNIQSGNTPAQENISPQTQIEVPVAVTPTEETLKEVIDPVLTADKHTSQQIAMAKTNLRNFQEALNHQYQLTMGENEDGDSLFMVGVEAFRQNKLKSAKKTLLLIPKTDPYFPSAQEILAFIYFSEKKYQKAAQCYESYANQITDHTVDWRLLQFYLADYQHHQADFLTKLEEITNPKNLHSFQKQAENLKRELGQIGGK